MKKKKHSFFETVEGEVVKEAGHYFRDRVKAKVLKWTEFSVLALLALIMISFGIANLIGSYVPELSNGLNFVLLGMVFLIMSLLVRM